MCTSADNQKLFVKLVKTEKNEKVIFKKITQFCLNDKKHD